MAKVTSKLQRSRLARARLFDQATARHRRRRRAHPRAAVDRGWTREDLYDRDRTR